MWALPSGIDKRECKKCLAKFLTLTSTVEMFLNCRTSVAHLDSPNIVATGLVQMLSFVHNDLNDVLDVGLFVFPLFRTAIKLLLLLLFSMILHRS